MEDVEYRRMREAEDGHWWYAGLHDLVLRFVSEECHRLGRRPDALDAGCGTGRMTELLGPLCETTACDVHPLALQATRARGLPRVMACDLSALAPAVGAFDIVVCLDVLYHRAVPDDAAFLRHLHTSLRPGGLLLLQVPAFEWLRGTHDIAVHTRRRYRAGAVRRLLAASGFRAEFVTYRLPLLLPPLLLWRTWSRHRASHGGGAPGSDVRPTGGIDGPMLAALRMENRLIHCGLRIPFGTSVFAKARRPATGTDILPRTAQ